MPSTVIGTLRARLIAETADFRNGIDGARKKLTSFSDDINKLRKNTIAQFVTLGGLAAALKTSVDVANEFDNAQRQLAATAKLTGVNLGFLESVSQKAQGQFRLSAISANALTIELAKLGSKAGQLEKASAGLEAFLDIGAARGLSAEETLKAVQQSILGIDEGTDKLFSKNPSVLYAEFAKQIGTTAGKLTDQQKAQALLNAAMQDGAKVRGEYAKWLESSAGQQFLLSQGIQQTQAALGKALQPALVAVLPVLSTFAGWIRNGIELVQIFGARLATLPPMLKLIGAAVTVNPFDPRTFANISAAYAELRRTNEAAEEVVAEIQKASKAASNLPAVTMPNVQQQATGAVQDGKRAAKSYFAGLQDEWENLRYSVALKRIELTATDDQRLALEEEHELALLAIERERLETRFRAKEIGLDELKQGKQELDTRAEIVRARRKEMEAANKAVANQQHLLSLADSVASLAPSAKRNAGSDIGEKAATVLTDKFKMSEMLGGFMGSIVAPGIGSFLGGAIGSLFSKDQDQQQKQTATLERIDQNTRSAATTLELQRRLIETARGAVNVPSRFSLPAYTPPATVSLQQTVTVNIAQANDPHAVVNTLRTELGPLITTELRKIGVGR